MAECCLLLGVYVVTRNWLATRNSLKRLAWVMGINGVAVALFALAQSFLSKGMIYWSFPAGTVFGPFVCRNHYPFFAYMTLGLVIGLVLFHAKSEYATSSIKGIKGVIQSLTMWLSHTTQSPSSILLLCMAMVIAITIPFSLSRGGIVTLIVASLFFVWLLNSSGAKQNLVAPLIIAAFTIGLGAWIGWGPVERRLGGISEGIASQDNRSDLWITSLRVAMAHPIFGCGANAFQRVEPMHRTPGLDYTDNLVNDSVHNEYLEALAEGGLLRFALTLVIALGAVSAAVRAFRRLGSRSNGSICAGIAFGLFGVAFHSLFDFGIHIPAIALLATVLAAYAEAAASDSEFVPTRRTKSNSSQVVDDVELPEANQPHRAHGVTLTGPPSWAMMAVVSVALVVLVRQYRIWDVAERYRSAAVAATKSEEPTSDKRIGLAVAAALASPDDPELQNAAAKAHFDAAVAVSKPSSSAWMADFPEAAVSKYLRPGLAFSQRARALCPYLAPAHMRFAMYGNFCESAEPSARYFERIFRVTPANPEARYAAGIEALARNDLKTAAQRWKESLALNGRNLDSILLAAKTKMSPEKISEALLPDDPSVLLSAADKLYPDRKAMADLRAPLISRAKRLAEKSVSPKVETLIALARIQYEEGDTVNAQVSWRKAVDLKPNDAQLRLNYAQWLESEELNEPLISELEWLKARGIGHDITNRLEAARRALELHQAISK